MFKVNGYKVEYDYYGSSTTLGDVLVTECHLVKEDGEVAFIGYAYCSPYDQFNRNTGRKISLSRALKNFSREERKLFWDAYYTAHGSRW